MESGHGLDNCVGSGRTAAYEAGLEDGLHLHRLELCFVFAEWQRACRVSHVQQLFSFSFFVCFGLTLLDDVLRLMATQLNGGRKQLVGRLTFGKIILGYSGIRRKKKEKKRA